MRIFTKSFLALALTIVCVGVAKAKSSLALPGLWSAGTKTDNVYSLTDYNGGSTWMGSDCTAYDYVWIKYSGHSGQINFAIVYDEFVQVGEHGDEYVQVEAPLSGSSGIIGIALDKTTTCTHGSKEGGHVGDVYAKNVRQVQIQSRGVASTLTIEGIYLGTAEEYLKEAEPAYSYVKDWTQAASYDMWHADETKNTYSISIVNNLLTVVNTNSKCHNDDNKEIDKEFWHVQYSVANNISTAVGSKYLIKLKIKATATENPEGETDIVWEFGDWGSTIEGHISVTNQWREISIPVVAPHTNCFLNLKTGNLYGTIEIEKVEVFLNERTIFVHEEGFSTYSPDKSINVDGIVNAYAAKYSGGKIVLTPVTEIPAGAGVIIEAAKGNYKVPVIESASALGSINELQVSYGTVAGNSSTIYALGKKSGVVGFVKVKSGVTIPAGKAYLVIPTPTPPSNAPDFIGFANENVTGVNEVKGQKKEGRSEYFNLAGQRVAQPTKGLYIVNGKKVILK